jgi:hypothetical protein
VFLNFPAAHDDAFAAALCSDLLELADLQPVADFRDPAGDRVPLDFGIFRDGDAVYAGVVARGQGGAVADEPPVDVNISLGGRSHLYDARRGKYLGHTDHIAAVLTPSIAEVYAALPYRLDGITVDAPRETARPGDLVTIRAEAECNGGTPGLQVSQTTVAGPDGSIRPAHGRRELVRGGTASIRIPLPLDAPPGVWRARFRDAATGVAGLATFTVEEAP